MSNAYGFAPQSVVVVLGTRPEIVKLAHIIRLLGDAAHVIHTGQHYDQNLSAEFFSDFDLPPPHHFLAVGSATRGFQIGETIRRLDEHLAEVGPKAVLVQGDTNSVAGGALAANAGGIFLCHIEAGLRSHDRAMPEEHNRIIADHLADLCCAPTQVAIDNLAAEGLPSQRVTL
ncbi:MAG: UDP-N-acetylglucosamine 2-epimerase, partial [Acidimicrobiia bacterium]|nr:UDP-N-acetylglucosamine 2-epimerase [Acidimicrobiia bacterium]